MREIDNIMRAEKARTGNYGADREEELRACPICGSVLYEKYFEDKFGNICGCDECLTERWAV